MKIRNSLQTNKEFRTLIWVFPLVVLLFLSGCSRSVIEREGLQLHRAGKFDEAVKYFEKALKENPKSQELRTLLFKSRLNSYYYHLALARRWKTMEKKEEAIIEYKIAINIFPDNKRLIDEFKTYADGKPPERPKFKSYVKPPVTLNVDAKEKISLNLRNTPITKIFKMLGKSFNVNFVFDKDFRDFVYTIEIDNIGFFEILGQLCMIGNAEYRVLDTASVLIYPNTTFKKRTFGLKGVKVFYLGNTDAEEAKKLVMTLFRDQQILVQEDKNLNSLIIKADHNTLREIEKFVYSIDKERSEVEVDIEILELNRNLIKSLGLNYDFDNLSSISYQNSGGTDGAATNLFKMDKIGDGSFFITLPSAALQFLESDDNTKIISKPNLRGVEKEEIKFVVGDDIPIPQTQFQAGAAGGVSNIPVTSYQYKNVGVEIRITPTIHRNREITMKIKLKMDFITGYRDNFPTLGKREMESVIRLKEGETSIIGGFIKDEIRDSLSGMPGLSKLPLVGRLFGNTTGSVIQTDLLFSVTPRIVRSVEIRDEDREAIWIDAQANQGGASTPPAPGGQPSTSTASRRNAIVISPNNRRVPVNALTYFTIRLNSTKEISSLSIGGSISGGSAEIEELKTDFFGGKNVKVLKNHSGDSFDAGYTFEPKPIRSSVLAQLKVKFTEAGNYTLSISSVSAYDKNRQQVNLNTSEAKIEVYQGGKRPESGERREGREDARRRGEERRERERE